MTQFDLRATFPAAYANDACKPVAGPWSAETAAPLPSGAVLILDGRGDVVAIATGPGGFSTEPDAPPPLDPLGIAANAARMAAVPELLAGARQLAALGPAVSRMMQASGQHVPTEFAAAVRLAERLMRDMPL